jgi:iron(II)-dependent oxidoreductase
LPACLFLGGGHNISWNGFSERDAAMLERMATMARYFGRRGFLQSEQWLPHAPTLHRNDTYASEWPLAGETLWTIINRGTASVAPCNLSIWLGFPYATCVLVTKC